MLNLFQLQLHHILDMMGMRKHVHRLNFVYRIFFIKLAQISCLCGRVATYIYYYRGRYINNFFH